MRVSYIEMAVIETRVETLQYNFGWFRAESHPGRCRAEVTIAVLGTTRHWHSILAKAIGSEGNKKRQVSGQLT